MYTILIMKFLIHLQDSLKSTIESFVGVGAIARVRLGRWDTYIHTYIHLLFKNHIYVIRAYIHAYIHTYIHAYIHAYIHTYINTYMRIFIVIYTYI